MTNYEIAFRVNDSSITHISLYLKTKNEKHAVRVAKRRLEALGYTINEVVWIKEQNNESL